MMTRNHDQGMQGNGQHYKIPRGDPSTPMPFDTIKCRLLWLPQYLACRMCRDAPLPDYSLLTYRPHPSIGEVLIREIDGRTCIGWRVWATNKSSATYPDELREPRWLDPISAWVLEAACWFGGSIFFNEAEEGELHYLNIQTGPKKSSVLGVIADSPYNKKPSRKPTTDHHVLTVNVLAEARLERSAAQIPDGAEQLNGRDRMLLGARGRCKQHLAGNDLGLTPYAHGSLLRLGLALIDELRDAEHAAKHRAAD